MKALGYTRVSGTSQVEGDGPVRQAEAIAAFCKSHDLDLMKTECEEGVSGTTELVDRPVLVGLISSRSLYEREGHGTPCIVVERLDRLARDLIVQEFILRECRSNGIKVFCVDQGALIDMANDGGDPTRKLIRQILGALAEWEKTALVLKLRKARDRKRAETGRCGGTLPFGSTPEEKHIKDAIFQMRAAGASINAIARSLNLNGTKTRFGSSWRKNTVSKILRRGV